MGLLSKYLFEPSWVESDHHLVANDNGRGRAALVFSYQLAHGTLVSAYVANFKIDSSRREEGRGSLARRSSRLRENNNALGGHISARLTDSAYDADTLTNSTSKLMAAVFCSMAETEQYLSLERCTASSTALRETLPPTR